ncbi:MAG: hypothetical protein HQ483_11710 [Rhodospirillales bacterium]|nr:hypothetical protein [Rhodospirillales bacterium]
MAQTGFYKGFVLLPHTVSRPIPKFFLTALFCILALAAFDTFAASDVSKKRTYGLRSGGEGHIQMRSLMAPVRHSATSKKTSTIPVTVILTVSNNKNVGHICNQAPRINDSLMSAWYQEPIPAGYLYDRERTHGKTNVTYRRTKAQKAEDKRLIDLINHAIGSDEVEQIMVLKGIMRMGSGAVTRLPFSSVNGCDELSITK